MDIIKVWARVQKRPLRAVLIRDKARALKEAEEFAAMFPTLDVTVQPVTSLRYRAHFYNDERTVKTAAMLAAFMEHWAGKTIGDGIYGNQSPPSIDQYILEMTGTPCSFHVAYAKEFWDQATAGLPYFARVDRRHPARPGDIACWGGNIGPAVPFGHLAVVVKDQGDLLQIFDQVPGPAGLKELAKTGLQGYYRPFVS